MKGYSQEDIARLLEIIKKDLADEPGSHPPFSFRIEGLRIEACVIKVKKIACRSLKGEA